MTSSLPSPTASAGAAVLTGIASAALIWCWSPAPAAGQTPEQTYADWTRLDFRPQEYQYRRNRMLQFLDESGGGLFLVPSSDGATEGGTFRQLEDFWYFTGLELPGSMLVFDVARKQTTLFMPERDERFENPGRPNDFPGRPLLGDYQLRGIAGVDQFRDVRELPAYLKGYLDAGLLVRLNLGAPGEVAAPEIPLIGHLDPVESLYLRLIADHATARVENAYEDVARMRMIKTPAEIRRMQVAAEATVQGIQRAAEAIRPGRDERSLQGIFEETCRSLGAQSIPFTPIVKSGINSLWPWRILASHYDRRNRSLQDGDLVILDVGCEIDGYISDVGRTFPVNGSFTPEQREKIEVSLRAADAIIAAVKPGVTLLELTQVALNAIPDHEKPYMQTGSFFGHHIGLSAGDPALMDVPLEPGMVFTVEPWYYNHDEGISVFVEDVVLVTADGVEVLTSRLARTPEQLEAMIR